MYDLRGFTLSDMSGCSAALRGLGAGAGSMEEAAGRIVGYLYDHLMDVSTGGRACALVRLYKTHPYGELDEELQAFARSLLSDQPASPGMRCLTLLATSGEEPEWNSRKDSRGHKAIPLPSAEVVAQIPMIAQLVSQFGLDLNTVLEPDPNLMVDLEQKTLAHNGFRGDG